MKFENINKVICISLAAFAFSCADNNLERNIEDDTFNFQLITDEEEGGDLASAEDYGVEITFADYIGELPSSAFTLTYSLSGDDDFENVEIDKVVYEVETDDCTFERELDFNPTTKTIQVVVDQDLGTIPESFEVVVVLPGTDGAEGTFEFKIESVSNNEQVVIGFPNTFEYEVLSEDESGEWIYQFDNEADFNRFKETWNLIFPELGEVSYADIAGEVVLEFGFKTIQLEIELNETEEVCEDGETDAENLTLELEADYEIEDGEIKIEGSYFVFGDDGEIEDELDYIIEGIVEFGEGSITLVIEKIIDQDNFADGEELFSGEVAFIFFRD
jgi:hypothetical protein